MFRTELVPKRSEWDISHSAPIMTIGSCFSDQIGEYFKKNKFKILSNPFGTIYNPISIGKLLKMTVNLDSPDNDTFVKNQSIYSNYDFHSRFSDIDRDAIAKSLKKTIKNTHDHLANTRYLIITLGTAFVYQRNDNKEVVANCHKVPASAFNKKLLDVDEITDCLKELIQFLSKFNKQLNIIFTVSPVRHIKDSLELNSLSKATLRLAIDRVMNSYDSVRYFPSYELQIDDLRDYRFYKEDMIHPNEVAEQYIWNKFQEAYFSEKTTELLSEWGKLTMAINHRPFNPKSEEHQKFLMKTINKLELIRDQLDVQTEIEDLKQQLIS